MSSNKALKLFGEAFLRTAVVLLGMAIIGFAVFFLVKVITTGGNTNDKSGEAGSTVDQEELQRQLDEENQKDSTEGTTADSTADEQPSEEASSEDGAAPENSSKNLKIVVLNSTGVKGLAGAWVDKLKAEGYTNVYAGNYKVGQLAATKVITVAEGNGTDLTGYFKGATIETGNLTSGFNLTDGSVSLTDIDIYIVVGTDDNIIN